MLELAVIRTKRGKQTSNPASPRRVQELDALRGVAVLGVVLYHYTTRFNEFFGRIHSLSFSFPYGYLGVQLFFIISGFVILMTLEKTSSIKKFLLHRFSRLYPSYWVAVIITVTLVKLFQLSKLDVGWRNAFLNLTMWQTFINVPSVDGVYWSLEVELVFYALISAFFLFVKPNLRELMNWFWLGVIIIWHEFLISPLGKGIDALAIIPLFFHYSPLFIAGMTFYRIWKEGPTLERYLILGGCLVALYFVSFSIEEFVAIMIFFGCFLLMINNQLTFVKMNWLLFLGAISYPLYLIHQNIGYIVIRFLDRINAPAPLMLIIPTSIVLLLATLIHYFVEVPGQRKIRAILDR